MSKSDAVGVCKATGLPFAAERWPAGAKMPLPCLAYDFEGKRNLVADGRVYASAEQWSITLFSERRDAAAEAAVESAISSIAAVPSEPTCGYDDERRVRWCMWTFEVPA